MHRYRTGDRLELHRVRLHCFSAFYLAAACIFQRFQEKHLKMDTDFAIQAILRIKSSGAAQESD